jgi:hypothetical protein
MIMEATTFEFYFIRFESLMARVGQLTLSERILLDKLFHLLSI